MAMSQTWKETRVLLDGKSNEAYIYARCVRIIDDQLPGGGAKKHLRLPPQ